MSEAPPPIPVPPFAFHEWDRPTPQAIATAYLDTFSAGPGRMVLEDMLFRTLFFRAEGLRDQGRNDFVLEILEAMKAGSDYRRGAQRWQQ